MSSKFNLKKRVFTVILAVLIMSSNSFAEYRITDDDIFNGLSPQNIINKIYDDERKKILTGNVISYDDISDIIHVCNPDILNNWNSWENNKSSNDVYNDYMSAADSLTNGGGDSDLLDAIANAQADALRIQADKNADDSYTNFLSYYLDEQNKILETKILNLEFFKSEYLKQIANESINECERKLETVKNQYEIGEATNIDLLGAKKNLSDAKSSYIQENSTESSYRRNFLINCGHSMNDNVEILKPNIDCLNEVLAINFNDDFKKAVTNNIKYEIYKRKLNNAVTDEVKKEYQILIDAAEQKIYTDLETKYNNILDAVDTIKNRKTTYDLMLKEKNNVKNSFDTGNATLKQYKTAEYNEVVAISNIEIAKYDLMIAYENYIFSVDGYFDC